MSLATAHDARSRAESAAADAAAVLRAVERKAERHKDDSSQLMAEYESFMEGLMAKRRAGEAAVGTAGPGGGAGASLVGSR